MLLRPMARWELPGWSVALRAAGLYDSSRWVGAPEVQVTGKWHGLRMHCRLADEGERIVYFLARYVDIPSQRALQALLRPGDTLIDIGANVGMMMLVGAAAVGPTGRVHCFEPNPIAAERCRANIELNHLESHVSLQVIGLSDEPGTLTFSWPTGYSDMGSFGGGVPREYAHLPREHRELPVRRGDDVLADLPLPGNLTIKVDVEGFEEKVLRGLGQTLKARRPAVFTEVEPDLLAAAGSSVPAVCQVMQSLGMQGYWIRVKITRPQSFVHRSFLTPLENPEQMLSRNVLWVDPKGVHADRVRGLVRA
jgi:FkbM family methyltransferase